MDDKTIFNQIIGQLAQIMNDQTDRIINAVGNGQGNTHQVDVVVSGNSISLLDKICNDSEASKKIEGVAASFSILNQELENYEKVFKGINDITYSGVGGQVQYIVDFLNIITDANYISKLAQLNEVLNNQKTSISDFFETFANDELIGKITSFNNVYKITRTNFDDLVEFLKSFDKVSSVSSDSISNINSIIQSLDFLTQDGIVQRFDRATSVMNKQNASSISDFFSELSNKLSSLGVVSGQNVNDLVSFLGLISSDEFINHISIAKNNLNRTSADEIVSFFDTFVSKLNGVPVVNPGLGVSLSSLEDVISKFSSQNILNSIDSLESNLSKEKAESIGQFFVELSNLLNGISVIESEQKKSLGYIRSLINMMGDGKVGENVARTLNWARVENATEFGRFFVELTRELNQIPSVTDQQNNCIKYVLELLKYMGQKDVIENFKKTNTVFNNKSASRLGSFYSAFANSLQNIPTMNSNQTKNVGYIISLLNFMCQEGVWRKLAWASVVFSAKMGEELGSFYSAFVDELQYINALDKEKIKTINSILGILQMVSQDGFVRKMMMANMFIGQRTGQNIGEFFSSFAQQVSGVSAMTKDDARAINTISNLLFRLSDDNFIPTVFWANWIFSPEKGENIGGFFRAFANQISLIQFNDFDGKKLKSVANFLESVTNPLFTTFLKKAIKFYGKKGVKFKNDPTVIPEWFSIFINSWSVLNNISNLRQVSNTLKSVSEFLDTVTSPWFITKLAIARVIYSHPFGKMWFINPKTIANWFVAFIEEFNKIQDVNDKTKALTNIAKFLDVVCSPLFVIKLSFASMFYNLMNKFEEEPISKYYNSLISGLETVFADEQRMKRIKQGSESLVDVMKGLLAVSGMLILIGIVGFVMIPFLPGIAIVVGVVGITMMIFSLIARIMDDKGDEFRKSMISLTACVLGLSVALMVIAATLILANKVKEISFVGVISVLIGMVVVIGIVYLLGQIKDRFGVDKTLVELCATIVLLSLSLLLVSYAIVIGNNIKAQGMTSLIGFVIAMLVMVGILAIIQMTGIGPAAMLAGMALAGVMFVMTLVMLLTLKVLQMASSAVKDLPKIKMLVVGLVDIMWDIAGKAALMGIVAPLIMAFAAGLTVLMFSVALSVIIGKLARLWDVKDKIALRNVVNGMIEVMDLVDEYFTDKSPIMNKIPFLGAIQKGMDVIAATAGLGLFAISIGALMAVTILSIVTFKLARIVTPMDIRAMKRIIEGFIGEDGIFAMIDNYFSDRTFGSSIPFVGPVAQMVGAVASAAGIILFSVSIFALMGVIALSIAVFKLAKTVKDRDIENVSKIVDGMISIFDKVGGTFLFGLLGNISKAASTGLFAAAMTPILALTSWYISITKKYYDADKQLGGLGTVSNKMVDDFKGFMNKINGSFGIMDGIATATTTTITASLIPMMKMIGQFVDVVAKVATMTFMSGYDSNGKPMYIKVPEDSFSNAADKLGNGFNLFMTKLKTAITGIDDDATEIIEELGVAMIPLMEAVSSYTDSIIRLATSQIVEKYDDKGKPVYKTVGKEMYGNAATVLADNFTTFMKKLVEESNKIKIDSEESLKVLSESMMPLMLGVSSFADAIVKLGTAMIPDKWDENGKPIHYINVPETVYTNAASVLASNFGSFIIALKEGANDLGYFSEDAVGVLSKSMSELMSGIGSFADAIVKLGTAGTPVFDDKGRIIKWEKIDAQGAANALIGPEGMFSVFMSSLKTGFEGMDGQTKESIKLLSDAMEPLMVGIGAFADSIIKMATGTYIEGYDKDGKPITKLIPIDRYKTSAESIATNFATFVLTLREQLFNTKGAVLQTLDALNKGGVAEVMKAVGNFIDAISKYTNGKMFVIEGFTKDGKPIYKKDKGKLVEISMKGVAENIATGFATFVSTMATKLNDPNLKNNIEQSKSVIEQLDDLMMPVKDFADTILKFKDNKPESFGQIGTALGQGLINVILALDGTDNGTSKNYLTTYGTQDFADQVKHICNSVDDIMDVVDDILDAKDTENLVKKATEIGKATISLLQSLDGTLDGGQGNFISKYSTDKMIHDIYNLSLNLKTVLGVFEDFNSFFKYDFKGIQQREVDFSSAVRTLMTIDFQNFEPKFGTSISKTINHLNRLDKKFEDSVKVTNKFKDSVVNAVDTIEKKLSANEKTRNEKFKTLSQNLENIANKLKGVQQGLAQLSNTRFDWVDNLAKKLSDMEKVQDSLQLQVDKAKSTSPDGKKSTTMGWDGKTPVPVVLVNGATSDNGYNSVLDEGIELRVDFSNEKLNGKLFVKGR